MIAVLLLALIPAVLIGYAVNSYIQNTVRTDKLNALAGTVHMMTVHFNQYYTRLISDVESKAETNEVEKPADWRQFCSIGYEKPYRDDQYPGGIHRRFGFKRCRHRSERGEQSFPPRQRKKA